MHALIFIFDSLGYSGNKVLCTSYKYEPFNRQKPHDKKKKLFVGYLETPLNELEQLR